MKAQEPQKLFIRTDDLLPLNGNTSLKVKFDST